MHQSKYHRILLKIHTCGQFLNVLFQIESIQFKKKNLQTESLLVSNFWKS